MNIINHPIQSNCLISKYHPLISIPHQGSHLLLIPKNNHPKSYSRIQVTHHKNSHHYKKIKSIRLNHRSSWNQMYHVHSMNKPTILLRLDKTI